MVPDCSYQHITFTTPDVLWHALKDNRDKRNDLIRTAIKTLMGMDKKTRCNSLYIRSYSYL